MTNTEQPKVEKKAYTKPELTEVRLVAEEAVLSVCKNGANSPCDGDLSCVSLSGS